MEELEAGLESIKRVTDRVNEERRRAEHRMIRTQLIEKVEDWKVLFHLTSRVLKNLILENYFYQIVSQLVLSH